VLLVGGAIHVEGFPARQLEFENFERKFEVKCLYSALSNDKFANGKSHKIILLSPTCKCFYHAIEVCNFNQLIQEEIFYLVEKHMKQFIFLSPRTTEWYCCITRGTCNNGTCTIIVQQCLALKH